MFFSSFNLILALGVSGMIVTANAQTVTEQSLKRLGSTSFAAASKADSLMHAGSLTHSAGRAPRRLPKPNLVAARRASIRAGEVSAPTELDIFGTAKALSAPTPTPQNIIGTGPSFFGFAGLTSVDTENANDFTLEPPDQGLAVGNGFVFEAVNLVFQIYDTYGNPATAPVSANSFFGLLPYYNAATNRYGPDLSDPRVYFDQTLQRWFATVLEIDLDPVTGNPTGRTHVYIATSVSSLPLDFNVVAIDTTDDGTNKTPAHPGCPCLPDQPLMGADRYGFYVSTNEYSLFGNGFNGTQIYALSKTFLAEGGLPTVVHFSALRLAEGIAYSVQPAISLHYGWEPSTGLEYFLSSLDFLGTLDNRIAVWAMTNTTSLNDLHPSVKLQKKVITSEVYGQPPPAVQNPGPYPLGTSLGNPLELIDTNDDRMNQVIFENGKLWAGVDTVIGASGDNVQRAGIAYFMVVPNVDASGAVTATISSQNYLSAPGEDSLMFPSIGATPTGKAAMTFSLVGPTPTLLFPGFYPSMAFARIFPTGPGRIQLGAAGQNPEDGFSGYPPGGELGVARWGDYSAAVADADGSIWMAAEWIPNTPRLHYTNWGTYIGRIYPQ